MTVFLSMNKVQQVIKADIGDAPCVALLHKEGIPTGFLSQQSMSFLSALYTYLINNEIVFVVKKNDLVVGFIAGTLATHGLYKEFLKENLSLLIKFGIKNIFSASFMKKAFETLFAPNKTTLDYGSGEMPELLSIVVNNSFKGRGIGKQLLYAFEAELSLKEKIKYKVLVGGHLDANKFYMRNGFTLKKELELHEGGISHLYIKNLLCNTVDSQLGRLRNK